MTDLSDLRKLYTDEQIIAMWNSATPHISFEDPKLKEEFDKIEYAHIIWGTSGKINTSPK